jgi:flagellar M-ring protein FliF
LRPATRALLAPPPAAGPSLAQALPAGAPPLAALGNETASQEPFLIEAADPPDDFLAELLARKDASPQRRLEKLIDFDEERAAMILKQWIRGGASA